MWHNLLVFYLPCIVAASVAKGQDAENTSPHSRETTHLLAGLFNAKPSNGKQVNYINFNTSSQDMAD